MDDEAFSLVLASVRSTYIVTYRRFERAADLAYGRELTYDETKMVAFLCFLKLARDTDVDVPALIREVRASFTAAQRPG